MGLDNSCPFYQNARCLSKSAPCDLACTRMGYGEEEPDELPKALQQEGKRVFFYSKKGQRREE